MQKTEFSDVKCTLLVHRTVHAGSCSDVKEIVTFYVA